MKGAPYLAIPVAVGLLAAFAMASGGTGAPAPSGPLTASMMAGDSPVLGDPGADITIVEWGDYQCTFCFRFHGSTLQALKSEYMDAGDVKLVFRDFPLNGPDSVLAAEASYCAEEQGRYWEYHDTLYKNWAGERTGWVTRGSLAGFAESSGLDPGEFESCMDDGRQRQRVLDTEAYGREIGVDATPSFFVFNDDQVIKIRGNQPADAFRMAIDELS